MTKKDDKHQDEPGLATGAFGDPKHPEVGAPAGAPVYQDPPVTEVVTDAKKKDEDEK